MRGHDRPIEVASPTPRLAADGRPLLPPRPNLGPEAWPSAAGTDAWELGVTAAIALVALLLGSWLAGRIARSRRRPHDPSPGPAEEDLDNLAPDERTLAAAELVRRALRSRFGPSWAAKTTEELTQEAGLVGSLGVDRMSTLHDLLAAADRAKFGASDRPRNPPSSESIRAILSMITRTSISSGRAKR